MSTELFRHGWRVAGVSLSIVLLLTLGIYRDTGLYMVGLWNQLATGDYGHGYVVIAISVYLIIRNRRVTAALTPCPNYWVLPVVLVSSLLWLLAALVDVQALQAASLLLLLMTIIWAVLGSQVTWKLLFPILFVGFAIPIWFPMAPLLQELTANAVFSVIRVLGLPAFRQENLIVLPAGTLIITEACSGLRYLMAALTLGTLYAYLNYATLPARMLVVLVAAGAAVLANILRVFIVVYLGYATEMQHPLVSDHLSLGWYLFGGLVIILVILDARFYRHHQPDLTGKKTVASGIQPDCHRQGNPQYTVLLLAVVLLASTGPAVVYMIDNQPGHPGRTAELELPAGVGGWIGPVGGRDDWEPEYHGALSYKQAYLKRGNSVTLFVGTYPVQRQGEELINDLNRIGNRKVWRSVYARGQLRKAGDLGVLEQVLEKSNGEQLMVWYWYSVSGRYTTNAYQAKALQVLGLVTGEPQASVIAVAINPRDDTGNARKMLEEFLLSMKAELATLVHRNSD